MLVAGSPAKNVLRFSVSGAYTTLRGRRLTCDSALPSIRIRIESAQGTESYTLLRIHYLDLYAFCQRKSVHVSHPSSVWDSLTGV